MKRNSKIIISLLGLAIIIVIIVWALNSNTPTYNNVEAPRPFKGNPNASVVITEFSDFECPACKNASSLVKQLAEHYQEKVKIEYKHFPLTRIHAKAFDAALASECANDQGKFWEMHDKIFENQENITKQDLKLYASQIAGIDSASFNACLDSRSEASIVNADIEEGKSLSIDGTPTFFLNGQEVANYNNLETKILEALQ